MRRSLTALSLLATTVLVAPIFAKPVARAKPVTHKTAPGQAVAGKPKIGAFGFDIAGMDRSVKPGDDFASFAGGTWYKNTEIPADRATFGMFNVLQDLSNQQTRDILEEAAKTPGSRIGDFYASFMDTAAADAKGITPIKPWLAEIAATTDKTQLAVEMARLARYGVGGRNLRAFRTSADREAALLQQILAPALRSRNAERRKEAVEALENLAAVTTHLKHLLLIRDLRKIAGS